jgi:ABC-2 type transport system ATP-binding protein
MPLVIQVSGLIKYYGDYCAISGVDFSVESGQIVALLGLNGSGKTTILRMLAGDLEPSAGSIQIGSHDLQAAPNDYRRRVGFLPEQVPIYPDMTVDEYLRYAGALRGLARADLLRRVDNVCERVDLNGYRFAPLDSLSHGFRKRLGIAATIIHDPEFVILDEPISGLDPVQIVQMRGLIKGLAGDHTVLLSSHILTEISQTCHEILVLRDGLIAARGTESELQARSRTAHNIQVTIRGDAKAGQDAIQAVPGVHQVTPISRDDTTVQFAVESDADCREAIARTLVQANLGLVELARSLDDLESAFVALTRSTNKEDA